MQIFRGYAKGVGDRWGRSRIPGYVFYGRSLTYLLMIRKTTFLIFGFIFDIFALKVNKILKIPQIAILGPLFLGPFFVQIG